MHAELALPCEPASVRAARRFVTAELAGHGHDDLAFTAALLVSELVTNAVLHARTDMLVTVDGQPDGVRVAVRDSSPVPLRQRRHSVDSGTGRGLLLVESSARRWGVEMSGQGKVVWFVVDAAPAYDGEPDLDAFLDPADRDVGAR